VITVPAYFNDAQRTATRDAGRIAGLEVLRIINEPTAASLAYGLDKRHDGTIAVYDLGGGTFDISILRVEDGVFQVLSTNGDTHLGGDDIDLLLTERVLADLDRNGPVATIGRSASRKFAKRLFGRRWICPSARRSRLPWGWTPRPRVRRRNREGSARYERVLTRAEFDELIAPVIERTLAPCRQALTDAGLAPAQIDEVVLVGGSTRIPLVRRRVGELFGRPPHTRAESG
jgi:molecular chaperone DnaK (HSP70)